MKQKIRVVDQNGNHRFLSPNLANNSKLMNQYGYKIEDPALLAAPEPGKKEDVDPALLAAPEPGKKEEKKKGIKQ